MKHLLLLVLILFAFVVCKAQDDPQSIYGDVVIYGNLYLDSLKSEDGTHTVAVDGAVELGTVAPLNEDTSGTYQFGAYGSSNVTTGSNVVYGIFPNTSPADTFVAIGTRSYMTGTSPSISIDPQKHTTLLSGSSTALFSSAQTITSTTTGDVDYFPANTYLLPGEVMWLETPTVTTAPDFLSVTVFGKWLNRAF